MRRMSVGPCSLAPRRGAELVVPVFLVVAAVAAPPLVGCGSSGGDTVGTQPVGNVVVHDENNYSAQSSLTIPVVETAPGADLQICWSAVSTDLLCHPADPVDNVAFLKIPNMSQDQVEARLTTGQLGESQVALYRELHTSGLTSSCAMLSALAFGSALVPASDYVESSTIQYLLLFTRGTTLGVGAQSMIFIKPTASSANVQVEAPDACASKILHFQATLGVAPVPIPTAGPWKLDWTLVTRDAFANSVSKLKLDKVELGFYEGMTADDLQSHFLDVEIIASSLYRAAVPAGQKYVDLATAKDSGGAAFPGFTQTGGTWAVAVLCSTCSVPAPVIFTILQPGS